MSRTDGVIDAILDFCDVGNILEFLFDVLWDGLFDFLLG